jgi:hypothetical protein
MARADESNGKGTREKVGKEIKGRKKREKE